MTMYDNENDNLDTFDEEAAPPEESNNRTFLLVAGGLGFLVLVALLCLGAYVLFNFNSNRQAEATAQLQATEQQATIAAGVTQIAQSLAETQTAAVTFTVPPTNTPVIAEATATFTETPNPATATVAAAFTQIAVSTQTIIPTSTALPATGFAEDVGVPGMLALAFGLVLVIFLVRRLRAAPAR
jgi:hypothetical protein